MYRVENKYYLSTKDMTSMENRISTILQPDSSGPLGYTVSSLYFDDIYDSSYHETIDVNPIRSKYRIRVYNNSFDSIKLEIKDKKYNRIQKSSCIISKEDMLSLIKGEEIPLTSEEIESYSNPKLRFNLALHSKGLRPRVIVTYERYAYTYPSGNVRITFDKNIRGSRHIDAFKHDGAINLANLVYDYPREMGQIFEVKYDEFLPRFISQTLENNQMLQCTNSKYCICREL